MEQAQIQDVTTYENICKNISSLTLSKGWSCCTLPSKHILIIQCSILDTGKPILQKQIVISENLSWTVYIREKMIPEGLILKDGLSICSIGDVQNLIGVVERTHFCCGGPSTAQFSPLTIKTNIAKVDSHGIWYHERCLMVCDGEVCKYCILLISTFKKRLLSEKRSKVVKIKRINEKLRR